MMKKRYAALAAAVLFFLLSLANALYPETFAPLRERLNARRDSVAVFRMIGERLSLKRDGTGRADTAEQLPADAAEAQARRETAYAPASYIAYTVEEGSSDTAEGDAASEGEVPAVVAAFLESQAAFSDYDLPESVDYQYTALPFSFDAPVAGRRSSGFGYRVHPILNTVRFHYGTDVAANAGEAIAAFADGTVVFAGYDDSYGWHLKIDHGGGWVSHYCHCSRLSVKQDDRVGRGDTVARVGATGLATGPHLHFELTHDGKYVNPEYYLNA